MRTAPFQYGRQEAHRVIGSMGDGASLCVTVIAATGRVRECKRLARHKVSGSGASTGGDNSPSKPPVLAAPYYAIITRQTLHTCTTPDTSRPAGEL
ncbi:hypothetical protein KCP73_19255 [Salmonella enterica subsp. enterica]|nr:hypothetical protein KCP73_19255 [Salmonella enterica subsp. enterica]